MKLMEKDGKKRWIPDAFIGYFRDQGYTVEGEEAPPPVLMQPEQGNTGENGEQTADEGADAQDDEQPGEDPEEERPAENVAHKCPYCGKDYKTEGTLKNHITRAHGGEQ